MTRSVQMSVAIAIWAGTYAAATSGLQLLTSGPARAALLLVPLFPAIAVCWITLRAMQEVIYVSFWRIAGSACIVASMLGMTMLYLYLARMQLA